MIISFTEESNTLMIAPMLFLPLLENSFKHGKSQEKDAFVELRIETQKNGILFFLKNSFDENVTKRTLTSSGIGLQNINKRLHLLYPNSHSFSIKKSDGYFEVDL